MTLNEMTDAMNENNNTFGNNYAGHFDISNDEAGRIAEKSSSVDEFIEIWGNEIWWTDEANQ